MKLEDLEKLDLFMIQLNENEEERAKSEMIEVLISNYKKYRGV